MNVKFLNQPKDVNFYDVLTERISNGNFSKIWIVAGFTKDSALDMLYESIEKAINNGTAVECVFGLDKKNTSKDMLLKFLSMGCKIRYHVNAEGVKFESRMFVFENEDGDSYVYLPGSKLSEGGITSNYTIIEEITYSKDEKIEFGKVKAALENGLNSEEFEELTTDKLKELASTGEILARITERRIPSINELYNIGSNSDTNKAQEYDEESKIDYSVLVNSSLDISIDDGEKVKVQESLGDEVEHRIKKAAKEEEDKVVTKMVAPEKQINYDEATTLILPITNYSANEIKIPSAVGIALKKFFNYPDFFHVEKTDKEALNEVQEIELEIFENISKIELNDDKARIIFTTKNAALKSNEFERISISDGDILRLIKVSSSKYRSEIIKKDSSEFDIWNGFCSVVIKGTTKKVGII